MKSRTALLSVAVMILLLSVVTILPISWSLVVTAALLFDLNRQRRIRMCAADAQTPEAWRLRWISSPILKLFKRVSPRMSQTEREALDAGSVWWDGELFSGKPHWRKLRKLQLPTLSEEEQAFLDGPTHQLCEMLDDWHITHERHDLPPEVWQFIKDNKFFSMIIPKSFGGLEFSALAHSSVVMKIATRGL